MFESIRELPKNVRELPKNVLPLLLKTYSVISKSFHNNHILNTEAMLFMNKYVVMAIL